MADLYATCPECESSSVLARLTGQISCEVETWDKNQEPEQYGDYLNDNLVFDDPKYTCERCGHTFNQPVFKEWKGE